MIHGEGRYKKIYDENVELLDMFGFLPETCDDEIRNTYVYAWFVKTSTKKYFYVGKGKNTRYNHIIREIEAYEKNKKKYKDEKYKILRDNIGIDYEFLYENLTDMEASVMEAYTMLCFYQRNEPLLNIIRPCLEDELEEYVLGYLYEKDVDKFLEYYK